ncbi:CocE/NonD family hydrolase [Seohaeicola saemankumensis]|uniref:CocE/NonD family hydrolase n=1 Tax=Seohaeicola saemankumensis TaxID=481181 RepID=UPI003AF368D1
MAARGYACIRMDLRGNGDSDGLMWDECSAQELSDAVEVILGPAARRWWGRWLNAVPNGAENDPAYRQYLRRGCALRYGMRIIRMICYRPVDAPTGRRKWSATGS